MKRGSRDPRRPQRSFSAAAHLFSLACALALTLAACGEDGDSGNERSGVSTLSAAGYPTLRNVEEQPLRLGPLGLNIEEVGWSGSVIAWDEDHRHVAFGVEMCVAPGLGVEHVTIDGVEPVETVGRGFSHTGTWLFGPAPGQAKLISVAGYVPHLYRDAVTDAVGSAFRYACGGNDRPLQLLIGLKAIDQEGGGWRGVRISYSVPQGDEFELSVPIEAVLCGASTATCDPGNEPQVSDGNA